MDVIVAWDVKTLQPFNVMKLFRNPAVVLEIIGGRAEMKAVKSGPEKLTPLKIKVFTQQQHLL